MKSIRIIGLSSYYQLVTFTRIKQAVFFSMFFPIMIFVLFTNIWGAVNNEYTYFLMTGLVAATVASDGFFAIGPLVKAYHENNMIKLLRNLPFNVSLHFAGMFFSRICVMTITLLLLFTCHIFLFDGSLSSGQIVRCFIGMILGLILFSYLGLVLAFFNKNIPGKEGLTSVIYFLMIFMSDVYFPVSKVNELFAIVTYIFPITYLLHFIRGEWSSLLPVLIWIISLGAIFQFVFTKTTIKR